MVMPGLTVMCAPVPPRPSSREARPASVCAGSRRHGSQHPRTGQPAPAPRRGLRARDGAVCAGAVPHGGGRPGFPRGHAGRGVTAGRVAVVNARWVPGRAEDLSADLGTFRGHRVRPVVPLDGPVPGRRDRAGDAGAESRVRPDRRRQGARRPRSLPCRGPLPRTRAGARTSRSGAPRGTRPAHQRHAGPRGPAHGTGRLEEFERRMAPTGQSWSAARTPRRRGRPPAPTRHPIRSAAGRPAFERDLRALLRRISPDGRSAEHPQLAHDDRAMRKRAAITSPRRGIRTATTARETFDRRPPCRSRSARASGSFPECG